MSKAHLPWPLLYFLYPLSSLAGQPSMGSLAPSLLAQIPLCARGCMESFVAQDFPTTVCAPPQDRDCLCTNNGRSGLTLGEGSLQCVASSCPRGELHQDLAVYAICNGIDGAKVMTHQTLTATSPAATPLRTPTRSSPGRSTSSSSSRSPSTRSASSTVITSTSSASSRTSPSVTPITMDTGTPRIPPVTPSTTLHPSRGDGGPVPSSTPSSPTSTSSATALAASAKPTLTKAQIAGVIVSSVAFVAIVLGLLFYFFFIRRKPSGTRTSGSSFGVDRIIDSRPPSPMHFPTENNDPEQGRGSRGLIVLDGQNGPVTPRRNNESQTSLLGRIPYPEIGIAVGPEMRETSTVGQTPPSAGSQRTNSRLLPDKPTYSLYPSPLRIKNQRGSNDAPTLRLVGDGETGQTRTSPAPSSRPSPRVRNSWDANQATLRQGYTPLRPSASDPFLESRSDAAASAYARKRRRPLHLETPSSNRPNPEILNNAQWTQSLNNLQKPVPARQSSSARDLRRQQAPYVSISPTEYAGRPLSGPFANTQVPSRKPVPIRGKQGIARRPSTHYSTASETSFEDAGDDDETPPLPVSQRILSPVQESPALRSTRGRYAYPKISTSSIPQVQGRAELESPTYNPARRAQPQSDSLVTQDLSPRKLKGILKPLPQVPEISDDSRGRFSSRRAPSATATETDREDDEVKRTAKQMILASPVLGDFGNISTPKSRKSVEWSLPTPTARSPQTPTRP